jgi:hypothetical protein
MVAAVLSISIRRRTPPPAIDTLPPSPTEAAAVSTHG